MRKEKQRLLVGLWALLLYACGAGIPANYEESEALPKIYPDYVDVTIPANMAPLTFELDDAEADGMAARYKAGDVEVVCRGKMKPSMSSWRKLTKQGGDISVDVFSRKGKQWTHHKPFAIHVSKDSIDAYLSYRLIPPSFVSYESLTINQRCLENYDESVIYDNMLCSFEVEGQCINCHHYQQYDPERMQFHARQKHGGTVIAYDGNIKKVDMRNDSILSAGVYPAWHPWLKYIVYSTDKTFQSFHTTDPNKIEVYDLESDIIAYDIDNGEVTNLENDTTEFEVFPAWAPDGKTLYYCSAHYERKDRSVSSATELARRSKELKYNIYKKSFDPETMEFGQRELVFAADSLDKSAVLPRISPDGRWLVFTMSKYGYFPIWHHEADLWIIDLSKQSTGDDHQSATARPLIRINSNDTESYHSWSSNGRWLVFSSRRDDGIFTRPFFAHMDENGKWGKPFELPQKDPDYHRQLLRSYNIPEFMHGPVTIAPQTFAKVLKGKGEPVKYAQQPNEVTITIMATNDMHGRIDNFAKVKALVDTERKKNPDGVLLLSGGDKWTGNPVVDQYNPKGYPMVDLMNHVGYDFETFGNHEFDLGQPLLADRLKQSTFPAISANWTVDTTISPLPQPNPYTLFKKNGIRIAILGLTEATPDSEGHYYPSSHRGKLKGLTFYDPIQTALKYRHLRDSCDLFVALTHIGHEVDKKLAEAMPELDVIVGAHSHTRIDSTVIVGGTIVTQTECWLKYLGQTTVTLRRENRRSPWTVADKQFRLISLARPLQEDAEVKALINDYNEKNTLKDVLCEATRQFDGTEALANVMADALIDRLDVDIALQNSGGVRIRQLPKGNVTKGDIFTLNPFNNNVFIYSMTPANLRDMISRAHQRKSQRADLLPGGIRYTIYTHDGKANRIDITDLNGKPLDESRTYRVAMNSYIATAYTFSHVGEGEELQDTDTELLIDYLASQSSISPQPARTAVVER